MGDSSVFWLLVHFMIIPPHPPPPPAISEPSHKHTLAIQSFKWNDFFYYLLYVKRTVFCALLSIGLAKNIVCSLYRGRHSLDISWPGFIIFAHECFLLYILLFLTIHCTEDITNVIQHMVNYLKSEVIHWYWETVRNFDLVLAQVRHIVSSEFVWNLRKKFNIFDTLKTLSLLAY